VIFPGNRLLPLSLKKTTVNNIDVRNILLLSTQTQHTKHDIKDNKYGHFIDTDHTFPIQATAATTA
jgi:hypothetical protein